MSEPTPPDEQRLGLDFASQVEGLALTAPTVFAESVLHAAAHQLRRHFGYSRKKKKLEILRRIKREPLGLSEKDLVKLLRFTRPDVNSLLNELKDDGRLVCREVRTRNGQSSGRPFRLFLLNPADLLTPKK